MEPGFEEHRFTGKTAAQWMEDLRCSSASEHTAFVQWYEAVVNRNMKTLAEYPRNPENHYCTVLAVPPVISSLPRMIRQLRLKRATMEQWLATLRSMNGKGLKAEELLMSGVLTRLQRFPSGTQLTQLQVLQMIDLAHVQPRLSCEARLEFKITAGWQEDSQRIPEKEFKRRGLRGRGYGAQHVICFRHETLGWSIARSDCRDLFTDRINLWNVLDNRGRTIKQPLDGFGSPQDAMDFAELSMRQHFASWGKCQFLSKWEKFALPGGYGYQEILLQLDEWPVNYISRHYRTRNVLAHIRTSIRRTQDGRRVLYLDEIQSDWHADISARARLELSKRSRDLPPDAPFHKEWPLLSLKLMVWWAQQLGVEGVAWSTFELQMARWHGQRPPEILYRTILPNAARCLSATLRIPFEQTDLFVRTHSRRVELGKHGWEVREDTGMLCTKPFQSRAQAERFADETGTFKAISVPVLWTSPLPLIRSIPLYGTGSGEIWF